MTGPEKLPAEEPTAAAGPAEPTELQAGVGQILVDFELGTGQTVKLSRPKRQRPLKGGRPGGWPRTDG